MGHRNIMKQIRNGLMKENTSKGRRGLRLEKRSPMMQREKRNITIEMLQLLICLITQMKNQQQ